MGRAPRGVVLMLASHQGDLTADAVTKELETLGARVARVDAGDFPAESRLAAHVGPGRWDARVAGVDLSEVTAVYYRRPTRFTLPDGLSDGDRAFALAEARLGFGGVLASVPALWVNDPVRLALAEYKPLQLRVADRVGLMVPRTLVTNDYAAAVDFAREVDALVCKTFSAVVLSENGVPRGVYATRVDIDQLNPDEIAVTAHLFQEWVPKAHDVRVTMVGPHAHAVAIHARSARAYVDWRIDYDELRYEPIEVPEAVHDGMRDYLAALGLHYGAFDFVVTPDGDWVFLECNPAGQFLWLEHETGLAIAASLARLLAVGDPRAAGGPIAAGDWRAAGGLGLAGSSVATGEPGGAR